MELKVDGRRHLTVSGQEAHIESYLARFGAVPATYRDERKFVRPDEKAGWEILDLDACPELSEKSQRLHDADGIRQSLTRYEWQLVGYTVHRSLVRILFDESGDGHWMIALWGFRDISPDLKDGYFNYNFADDELSVEWPDRRSNVFEIELCKKINVCAGIHGRLDFFDWELNVNRHIVPEHIRELDGWPLNYWSVDREEFTK